MKKLFVLSLMLVITHYGFSQTGLKAGLNQSTVKDVQNAVFYDYKDSYRYRPGYYVGVFTTIGIIEKLAFQPELFLSLKGSRIITHPQDELPNRNLDLFYLNLPLLVNFSPFKKITFIAGAEAGLLIRATSKYDGQPIIIQSDFNRMDLGAAAGINYKIIPAVSAEFRYTHGLLMLSKNQQSANKTFQFGMAYHFVKQPS